MSRHRRSHRSSTADILTSVELFRPVGCQRRGPCPSSIVGFVSLEGRAAGAELLRLAARVLELGSGVGVDELTRLYSLEAVPFEKAGVRCFQQRPGNSAGPEVDVATPFRA